MHAAPLGAAFTQIRHLFTKGTAAGLPDALLLDRFLENRDEAAFAALVERHGPMVLGTCLAVLRDPDDAEDAFQATFLTLARRARSIRDREAMGGWLHRVARRVALRANARSARRRAEERRGGLLAASRRPEPVNGPAAEDLAAILHDEIDRLPDRHRLPLVLCHLEGRPHALVADDLRWSERTLRRRLAEARDRLRARLQRRGVDAPFAALPAMLGRASSATVPVSWAERASRIASAWAVGSTAPASLAALRELAPGSGAAAAKGMAGLIAAAMGVGAIAWAAATEGPGAASIKTTTIAQLNTPAKARGPTVQEGNVNPPSDPDAAEDRGTIVYHGRVLGPDGAPIEGATLHLHSYDLDDPNGAAARATSDAEGRFRFEVPKAAFDATYAEEPWRYVPLLARAEGLGVGLAEYDQLDAGLSLRLPTDDRPVQGRVIDLQGRPVAGARVRLRDVSAPNEGDLTGWLDALRDSGEAYGVAPTHLSISWSTTAGDDLFPAATTDADGRFRIDGIGRERVAELLISGSTIETSIVHVMTRAEETIRVPEYARSHGSDLVTYHGTGFEHVAGPSRPVEGVVRDLDSGVPLEGILVVGERAHGNPRAYVESVTDARGRYRLVGLPRGREGYLLALPPSDAPYADRFKAAMGMPPDEAMPYLRARFAVGDEGGIGPVSLDVALKRGVWVTGRVVDAETNAPASAQVSYFVFSDNPGLEEFPGYRQSGHHFGFTGLDGTFGLVAFPGPGLLAARADEDRYAFAVGADAIGHRNERGIIRAQPSIPVPSNFHVLAEIDPAADAEAITRDLRLDPGRALSGTVLDPDGMPLSGATVAGQKDMAYWEGPLEGSSFEVVGLLPGKGRTLNFRHDDRELVGLLELTGDEPGPLSVRLGPWGSAVGRVVDVAGEAVGKVELIVSHDPGGNDLAWGRVPVDREGRFRVEGLVPGERYRPYVLRDGYLEIGKLEVEIAVAPGESKDLGDVTMIAPAP